MKKVFAFIALSVSLGLSTTQAQSQSSPQRVETRPRTVTAPRSVGPAETLPAKTAAGTEVGESVITPAQPGTQVKPDVETSPETTVRSPVSARPLSPNALRLRIAEAERFFRTRPKQTAITSQALDTVTLALLEQGTSRTHLLTLSKQSFLSKGAEVAMTTSLGTPVTLRVLRANGVNTAVTVFDNTGRPLAPLAVEFPIEKAAYFARWLITLLRTRLCSLRNWRGAASRMFAR